MSWLLLALLVVETFFERRGLADLITNSVNARDIYGLEPFLLAFGLFIIAGHSALSIIRGWTERSSWVPGLSGPGRAVCQRVDPEDLGNAGVRFGHASLAGITVWQWV